MYTYRIFLQITW